jgi:hypothetical protein
MTVLGTTATGPGLQRNTVNDSFVAVDAKGILMGPTMLTDKPMLFLASLR